MVPGLKTYTNLTCRRGATGHVEFWNWIKDALGTDHRLKQPGEQAS
ncbi:MAG: hypothetical protein ACREF4_00960 [Gammaproteobacteria bacterium]